MLNIYSASAGSGKTFTLTQEYLRLLLSDRQSTDRRLPHSRILAVTFTKKATAEMKERILRELYILSIEPTDSEHWSKLHEKTGIDAAEMQRRARKLMVDILQDYTRFSVSTIDGFFQQVIRSFARELGLSASYDLSLDGEEMVGEAVDEIFLRLRNDKEADKELLQWMMDFTQKNIEDDHKWNPHEAIKQFAKELLKERLSAEMPALQKVFEDKNFIRQYRQQMQEICEESRQRIDQLLQQALELFGRYPQEVWNKDIIPAMQKGADAWLNGNMGKTFVNILAEPNKSINKSKAPKADQPILLELYTNEIQPIFVELSELCLGDYGKDYVTAQEILPHIYTLGILQDVAKQIETTNRNIGRLPISETNKLVNEIIDGQEAPFIYERYGQYFRHYMIDEFQDTSRLQWKNFKPLVVESLASEADNLIVGDVKQSIYRFRNSEWSLLRDLSSEITPNDTYKLENNWRTAGLIVEENEKLMQLCSQQVAENLSKSFGAEHWGEDIRYIFNQETMHQEPASEDEGYFHLQFFEGKDAEEQTLEQVHEQLQALQQEGIELKRVTLLVRYTHQAALLANYLIGKGYNVQSAEGLQLGTHPSIKLLINLLQQEGEEIAAIPEAYIHEHFGQMSQELSERVIQAQQLPLYEQLQTLIAELKLHEHEDAVPYLSCFQDLVYQFTRSRVADRKMFLEYWERKGKRKTISAQQASNALRVMTIHSSKGLEFDIVFIPFFNWEVTKTHRSDIIWCAPKRGPFNQVPLVPVHPSKALLQSHFKQAYIQEQVAQAIDNLNLVYVAITRPKYRLYIYGQLVPRGRANIGTELYALYKSKQWLDEQLTYRMPKDGHVPALPNPEKKKKKKKKVDTNEAPTQLLNAQYVSVPIGDRLTLRSRAEDDFEPDTPLSTVDLGIKMHLWLSSINTWEDAEPALQRLLCEGQITEPQAREMQGYLQQLQQLLQRNQHEDWFAGQYQLLTEQDILVPSAKLQRPDRIMIQGNKAVVIDYKFGHIQRKSHYEQLRTYMALLSHMGYTTEGYLVYSQLQIIQPVK